MCQDGCSCQKAALIFGVIWTTAVILTSVLVAFSFSTVNITQVGLKYDFINQNYDKNNIYLNGRHWVGLGAKMEVFDIDYKEINFNPENLGYIITKTSDPSEISIEVYIMYRLRPEFLLEIFKSYPDMDYEYSFNLVAKDAILDLAQNFTINDYMTKRTQISEAFLDSVNRAFRNVYIELVLFELGEILFYKSYEEAIIENIKSMNDATVQNVENSLDYAQGNLDNLYSNMNLNINNILYKAKSNIDIMRNNIENQYFATKINSESKAYKQFMDPTTLAFTPKEITKLMLYNKIDFETFFDDYENMMNKTNLFSDPKMFEEISYGANEIVFVDK